MTAIYLTNKLGFDDQERTVMGVGYNSGGRHKVKSKGVVTLPYRTWRNMLERCYSDKLHKKQPSYADCFVSDEWLDFQVFAEWLTSNEFYNMGYQLDKDILQKDCKVYSKDTVALVPQEINKLLNKRGASRGSLPIGVTYHERDRVFRAQLTMNGYKKMIGSFDCPHKAHEAYTNAKQQHVRDVAEKWRDKLDPRVYLALSNWEFKEGDE